MNKTALMLGLGAALVLGGLRQERQRRRAAPARRPPPRRRPDRRPSPPAFPPIASSWSRPRAAGHRQDARRPRPLHGVRSRRRRLRQASARNARQFRRPAAAGEDHPNPHLSDSARHRARRRHRQDHRQRQGQGGDDDGQRPDLHRVARTATSSSSPTPPATPPTSPRPDQQFSNGVVHQIDAVLMPPQPGSARPSPQSSAFRRSPAQSATSPRVIARYSDADGAADGANGR